MYIYDLYKDANSLADWAHRLFSWKLDKTLQKTDWFQTPYNQAMEDYMMTDVWILHKILDFLKQM